MTTKPKAVSKPTPPQQAVAVQSSGMMSITGVSPHLAARLEEVKDNLESVENFRLPRVKMTSTGFELIEGQPVLTELEGVIIYTRKTNVYYAGAYNPRES